jgi:hypothetical protein
MISWLQPTPHQHRLSNFFPLYVSLLFETNPISLKEYIFKAYIHIIEK